MKVSYNNIKERAVNLAEFGVNNYAFIKKDTLALIEILESKNIPILGGDVYEEMEGKFKMIYENWYCDRTDCENEDSYVHNSAKKAISYVSNFNEKQNNYFSLTFKGREDFFGLNEV